MAFILPIIAAVGEAGAAVGAAAGAAGSALGGLSSLGTIASVVGTGVSALGAINQGAAAKASGDYNAAVARNNAIQSETDAAAVASQKIRESNQRLAASRAGAQENGLELTGSTSDVLGQAQNQGTLDYLTAVYSGQVRAQAFNNNAALSIAQGNNAQTAGYIGAGTQLFNGFARAYKFNTRPGNSLEP